MVWNRLEWPEMGWMELEESKSGWNILNWQEYAGMVRNG